MTLKSKETVQCDSTSKELETMSTVPSQMPQAAECYITCGQRLSILEKPLRAVASRLEICLQNKTQTQGKILNFKVWTLLKHDLNSFTDWLILLTSLNCLTAIKNEENEWSRRAPCEMKSKSRLFTFQWSLLVSLKSHCAPPKTDENKPLSVLELRQGSSVKDIPTYKWHGILHLRCFSSSNRYEVCLTSI